MRKSWPSLVACSALLVVACSDNGTPKLGDVTKTTKATGSNGQTGDGTWTVLVYMAADNSLEGDSVNDIQEMANGVTANVNLFVLDDRSAKDTGDYSGAPVVGVGNFSGAHLLHVTTSGVKDLQNLGEVDMSDPALLQEAGTQVFKKYPAQHTALVLWDHANGWQGYAADDSSGHALMSPDQMQGALQKIIDASGIGKFSIVSFDACLMAELEVASSMAPVADYLLGSEETVPAHGMDYSFIGQATTGDAVNFGTKMIEGFRQQAETQKTLARSTMSLIDLSKVAAVGVAVDGLQKAIAADPAASVEFLRAADAAAAFAYDPDPKVSFNLRDLGQIVSGLAGSGGAVAAASTAISAAVDAAVVTHIEGTAFTGVHGLSVYAPISIEDFRTAFNDVKASAHWSHLMDTVYSAGTDTVGGADTSFVGKPEAAFESGSIKIAAQVSAKAAKNLASVTVFYGAFVPAQGGYPDLVLMLGRLAGTVIDPTKGIVGGALPVLQLGISNDGGGSGLLGVFSPIPSPDGTTTVLTVPVRYMAPGVAVDKGQEGYVALVLDSDANIVGRGLYLKTQTGALAQVTPDPAGTIQTIVLQIGADGSVVPVPSETYTTPPSLPATLDTYTILAKARAPGDGTPLGNNLGFGVIITDAGGTTHITFAKYTG